MTVTAIHDLRDYARVSQYLQSLQQVTRVQTLSVDADRIGFELQLRGDPAGIVQTIALGTVLTPVAEGIAMDGQALPQPQPVVYRLVP